MNFHLTIITKQDAYNLLQVSQTIFNEYERYNFIEDVRALLNKGFLAKTNTNEIIGYITFDIIFVNFQPKFTIMALGVKKEYRKQGVGKKLLQEVKRYFIQSFETLEKEHNIKQCIYLQVRENNHAARNLYEKEGFQIIANLKEYYVSPDEDGILMKFTA